MSGGGGLGSLIGGAIGFLVGGPAGAAIGAGMGGMGGMQYDQQKAAQKAAEEANNAAAESAKKNQALQEQAMNRANAKTPDAGALLESNARAATTGAGSTMLTGPQGVNPNNLQLGKNTLLGG